MLLLKVPLLLLLLSVLLPFHTVISTTLTTDIIRQFESTIEGSVTLPEDSAYDQYKVIYNEFRLGSNPAGLIQCKSADDVSKAILFLDFYGIHPRVKSGGHSFSGWCQTEGGWVIDMRLLTNIEVDTDDETITFGAGNRWGALYGALEGTGYAVTGGLVHDVGTAGFILGGGRSALSRKYGYASDTVVSMEVVLANGSIVTAKSKGKYRKLFWALLGAGHNNYGVVTTFKMQIFKEATSMGFYVIPTALSGAFPIIFAKFVEQHRTQDRSISVYPTYLNGLVAISVWGVGSDSAAQEWFANFTSDLFPRPVVPVAPFTVAPQSQLQLGEGFPTGKREYVKAAYYTEFGNPTAYYESILEDTRNSKLSGSLSVGLAQVGGAISDFPEDASAASHRNAIFTVILIYNWNNSEQDSSVIVALGQILSKAEMSSNTTSIGSYINYPDETLVEKNWEEIYYGDKEVELQKIKEKYDQQNFFEHEFGIKSTREK